VGCGARDLAIHEQRLANLALARRVKTERTQERKSSREREEELRAEERRAQRERSEFGSGLTLTRREQDFQLAQLPRGRSAWSARDFPESVCLVCQYGLAEPTAQCEDCKGMYHVQCCAQAPPGYYLAILCGYCFQKHYALMRSMREERSRAALTAARAASSAVVRTAAQAGALTGLAVATGARVVQACRAGFQCGAQVGWAAGGEEIPTVGPTARLAADLMGAGQGGPPPLGDGVEGEDWQEADEGDEDPLMDPWDEARRKVLAGGMDDSEVATEAEAEVESAFRAQMEAAEARADGMQEAWAEGQAHLQSVGYGMAAAGQGTSGVGPGAAVGGSVASSVAGSLAGSGAAMAGTPEGQGGTPDVWANG